MLECLSTSSLSQQRLPRHFIHVMRALCSVCTVRYQTANGINGNLCARACERGVKTAAAGTVNSFKDLPALTSQRVVSLDPPPRHPVTISLPDRSSFVTTCNNCSGCHRSPRPWSLSFRDKWRHRSRRDELYTNDSKRRWCEKPPLLITGAKINFKAAELNYLPRPNTNTLDHVWPNSVFIVQHNSVLLKFLSGLL